MLTSVVIATFVYDATNWPTPGQDPGPGSKQHDVNNVNKMIFLLVLLPSMLKLWKNIYVI
jgi:hypothetical protein